MPKTGERQKEHIARIRQVLVMKSNATILKIKKILEEDFDDPLKLDKDYINRLVNKIRGERAKRIDYYTLNQKLAEFEDKLNESDLRLWAIVNEPFSDTKNKIAALREIRNNNKELFDKMFDAGVFKRKIGEIEIGEKLSDEEQDLLKKAIELSYETNKKTKPKTKPKNAEHNIADTAKDKPE